VRFAILTGSILAAGLGSSEPSVAASFRVAPVTVQMTTRDKASTVTLFNDGSMPVAIQIRPFVSGVSTNETDLGFQLTEGFGVLVGPTSL
jgi:P pilus assembly chaperone PapD